MVSGARGEIPTPEREERAGQAAQEAQRQTGRDVLLNQMTRTPRTTFATSVHRAGMEKLAATEDFLVACDYALLMHAEEIINPMDPTGLAQIIGARRVLEILKTIGDPLEKEKPTKPSGLKYE
jgi:hypothetical protein